MRNAQPAQGLSATSFDFSSGRNGGCLVNLDAE
jgi:hypothetical protein